MRLVLRLCLILTVSILWAACGGSSEPTPVPTEAVDNSLLSAELSDVGLASEPEMRTFTIDPAQSTAYYIVEEELFQGALEKYGLAIGNATVTGSTGQVDGVIQLDLEADEALGPNRFVVHLPTLTTDQNNRDEWIRENALESERFPLASFEATSIEGRPDTYVEGEEVQFDLVGNLTIRDIVNPIRFTVQATLEDDSIRGVALASSQMTDWGFDPPSFAGTLTVSNDFQIRLEFVAIETP